LIKFSECQVPLRKFKPPIQDFLAMVLVFWTSHLFTRQFSCTRFLPVWKSKKHANREPNSYNHLGAFNVTCFARVCEIFTAVVSELQHGPHVVLQSLYARCSVFFLFLNTDKKKHMWFL